MTIYFALLIVALVAMLIGCLFMYLEIRRFGGFGTVPGRVSLLDRPGQTQVAVAGDAGSFTRKRYPFREPHLDRIG